MTLNAIVSVADEQVTAATQQRALDESDNSEQLQLEPTPQFQPTANTGLSMSCSCRLQHNY